MRCDPAQPALPGVEEWFRLEDGAAALVERSRAAQGLPQRVEDRAALERVAAILARCDQEPRRSA